jgi:hypothetical protein
MHRGLGRLHVEEERVDQRKTPLSRGMSFVTASTASGSSTLSRMSSHVGLVSRQRRPASIFARAPDLRRVLGLQTVPGNLIAVEREMARRGTLAVRTPLSRAWPLCGIWPTLNSLAPHALALCWPPRVRRRVAVDAALECGQGLKRGQVGDSRRIQIEALQSGQALEGRQVGDFHPAQFEGPSSAPRLKCPSPATRE